MTQQAPWKAANYIQVNHCKTVGCAQFGLAPKSEAPDGSVPNYKFQTHPPVVRCGVCNKFSSLKSNQGVAEELQRIRDQTRPEQKCCPSPKCENQRYPLPDAAKYHQFGTTAGGSRRYRCKICKKTFSVITRATTRQRRPELNEQVFKKLMNKAPMRRLCEELEISPSVLYGKIDFIHRQCVLYNAAVERRLNAGRGFARLYLSSDRQDYVFNWGSQLDRTNVTLHAIGTADNVSGYVFGMHLDFDPDVDAQLVEKYARAAGDLDKPIHARMFARLWLLSDYDSDKMLKQRVNQARVKGRDGPKTRQYAAELQRRSTVQNESVDLPAAEVAAEKPMGIPPPQGMQVRSDYSMLAHFFIWKN